MSASKIGGVASSGYMFENDAYWWKPDTVYFKLNYQCYQMGFTIKYPDIEDGDDPRLALLQLYMQNIENLMITKDDTVAEYIDVDSFVSWILVRDIMRSGDGGGSNIYYYLQGLDLTDLKALPLMMGPLWDFDAGMSTTGDHTGWSTQHTIELTYFPYLFEMPFFRAAYRARWEEISRTLAGDFVNEMESFYNEYGTAIDESRRLDAERWDHDYISLRDEIDQDEIFIRDRIQWMSTEIQEW